MQNATFDALVARAEQRRRSKLEVRLFEVPGFGALEFHKPSDTKTLEYFGMISESDNAADVLKLCDLMIYDGCPTLQDTALHRAIDVQDPADVVPALFTVHERNILGGKLLEWLEIVPADEKEGQKEDKNSLKNGSSVTL